MPVLLPGLISAGLAASLLAARTPLAQSPTTPAEIRATERIEKALPGFVTAGSRRFRLVSDLAASERDATLRTLEATADAVDAWARSLGLRCRDLDRPLVGLAFRDRAMFERYARDHDRIDARWMVGYWSPGSEQIVMRAGAADGQPAPRRGGVLASSASATDRATIAHEAAHQLLHRLGVQRRSPNHPLWVSEGLAMGFETFDTATDRISPFAPQPDREAIVRSRLSSGSAVPLATLVSTPRLLDSDRAGINAFYAQSWSLTRFLATTRPTRLALYLSSLASDSGRHSPRHSIELFERAFGPLHDVEPAWRAWAR